MGRQSQLNTKIRIRKFLRNRKYNNCSDEMLNQIMLQKYGKSYMTRDELIKEENLVVFESY